MNIDELVAQQIASWSLAANNYDALKKVQTKEILLKGIRYVVQYNPSRKRSSAAKVDAKSLSERACFLCKEHRPQEQKSEMFLDQYEILLNPYPIFPKHLTIPTIAHTKQILKNRVGDMLQLAAYLSAYTVFYNGAYCGASAPDHCHFQAAQRGIIPLEKQWRELSSGVVVALNKAQLHALKDAPRNTLVVTSTNRKDVEELTLRIIDALPTPQGHEEPMLNILSYYDEGEWVVMLFPRIQHRPSCYGEEKEEQWLISPASVDMGGLIITPLQRDFEKIDTSVLERILEEVCWTAQQRDDYLHRLIYAM